VVAAGVVGYLERERLGDPIATWLGEPGSVAEPDAKAPGESPARSVAAQAEPDARPGSGPGAGKPGDPGSEAPARPGQGPDLEDAATALPRERIVSDPETIERELERLVAQREADTEATDAESDERRRDRRSVRQPTNIVVAESRQLEERRREQEAREQEALARMEERMAAARERREARARAAERAREAARNQPAEADAAADAAEVSGGGQVANRAADSVAERSSSPQMPAEEPGLAVPTEPAAPTEAAAGIDREPDSESWSPQAAEYVRVWELPLSIRRNLPELKLNIHVYSEQPRQRFVLVNGERFRTGDTLADGVRLVEIRREGAILDFRDYRFLLDP
jgi:hypothetical protein